MSSPEPGVRAATVIVVGSINIDLVSSDLDRLPRPGETITAARFAILPGGKGANQAAAAARLGADVRLVASVGNDEFAARALADLEAHGVATSSVQRVEASTGVATVLIDRGGENSIVVSPGANDLLAPESADAAVAQFDVADAVVIASLEIPMPTVLAWARIARRRGWRFMLNPAPHPRGPLSGELLKLVDVITPNGPEFESIAAAPGGARRLAAVPSVVITRGGEGVEVRAGGGSTIIAPHPVRAVDTTGAGDAFTGALAVALAEGASATDAARFANAAGALATRAVGARGALPSRAEVDALLADRLG